MLHKREMPSAQAADLALVFAVKLKLLCWVLETPPANPVTRADLDVLFTKKASAWLWARICRANKKTAFGHAIDALAAESKKRPHEAGQAAVAIRNDAKFDKEWGVAGFELKFFKQHKSWVPLVQPVGEPFYKWLTKKGFDPNVFLMARSPGDQTRLSRQGIADSFREDSPIVCGYCDGPLGDKGTKADANDCDHFFPCSAWPHLAVHPRNLFMACKGCNEVWKLDRRPMGEGDAAGLLATFHPQYRPGAAAITVEASQCAKHPSLVQISIADKGVPDRAKTLNETLDLAARWTNDMNFRLRSGTSALVSEAIRRAGMNQQHDRASIDEAIAASIAFCEINLGKKERAMREAAVLLFQRKDKLSEILEEFGVVP